MSPDHNPFATTAHRPWPLPGGPWVMAMAWEDLLFAHWEVAPSVLAPLLPVTRPELRLDTRDGRAWLGLVPFRMSGVRPRGVPALPGVSRFPELNLRTYVTAGGRPGVWFFSLDAANPFAVRVARATFHLPYFDAEMACDGDEHGGIRYASRRTHRGAGTAVLRAAYRPTGKPFRAGAGSLEHWLTERYCLYAADRAGRLYRGEIQHRPWPLQPARATFEHLDMTDWLGLPGLGDPSHLLFARRLDVVAWAPGRVRVDG